MPSVQTPTVVSALGVVHVALPPAHGAPVTTEHDLICQQSLSTHSNEVVHVTNQCMKGI